MKLSILGALASALLLFACNADLRGTLTPPLEGGTWVWPTSEPGTTSGDLTLVEFFSPT